MSLAVRMCLAPQGRLRISITLVKDFGRVFIGVTILEELIEVGDMGQK